MKKILIYGDSNTWGDNFCTGIRIPDDKQWVNILRKKLGDNFVIFQEGLPGRLAGNEEKEKTFKNGKDTFISTFRSNAPLNTLIIALGSNDLQIKYSKKSKKIIEDLLWYKNILEEMYEDDEDKIKYFNNKFPRIIFILPPNFDYLDKASIVFDIDSENKRKDIINYFSKTNFEYLVFNDMILFDDGLHFNYNDHNKVAEKLYEVLKNE